MRPSDAARNDFSELEVLLVDDTPVGMMIAGQILTGLGVRKIYRCETVAAARPVLERCGPDLAIIDSLTGSQGYVLVRWIRTEMPAPTCYIPILMTAAHTTPDDVAEAMSCGIDFLIKKPLSAQTLIERTGWICRADRPFVYSDVYIGPERRGPKSVPPALTGERRQAGVTPADAAEAPIVPLRRAGGAS